MYSITYLPYPHSLGDFCGKEGIPSGVIAAQNKDSLNIYLFELIPIDMNNLELIVIDYKKNSATTEYYLSLKDSGFVSFTNPSRDSELKIAEHSLSRGIYNRYYAEDSQIHFSNLTKSLVDYLQKHVDVFSISHQGISNSIVEWDLSKILNDYLVVNEENFEERFNQWFILDDGIIYIYPPEEILLNGNDSISSTQFGYLAEVRGDCSGVIKFSENNPPRFWSSPLSTGLVEGTLISEIPRLAPLKNFLNTYVRRISEDSI
ncbi:MAG: hypothetical protein SOR40_01620 [Rothia sp. (in: high G+C Gram-positive bacteria)]|nr:hypothetical protein [Rothia sp. (in: high G+C Gram-positive bacteria)]